MLARGSREPRRQDSKAPGSISASLTTYSCFSTLRPGTTYMSLRLNAFKTQISLPPKKPRSEVKNLDPEKMKVGFVKQAPDSDVYMF